MSMVAHTVTSHPARGIPDTGERRFLARWWHFAADRLLMLPLGAAIALAWVNTDPESYFRATGANEFFVQDVAMVLFFGLIMKEVVEATAPGGVLHPWRRAAMPLVASIGLTLVPLTLFVALTPFLDEPRVLQGWPAVFATDVAFGYVLARVIFGNRPAVPFFLLLAIGANSLGILALATVGASSALDLGRASVLMITALTLAGLLRTLRVRSADQRRRRVGGGLRGWPAGDWPIPADSAMRISAYTDLAVTSPRHQSSRYVDPRVGAGAVPGGTGPI